ncbi:MAG: alginate export family protein [Reichenbachiella sp.]|uniref:alginate export family protein n=1 Tax=Reichenbachiella sp. TaxID=2184521 RepID=UPI003264E39C
MRNLIAILGVVLFTISNVNAQFTLSGEYRPRAEYRHGFQALPNPNQVAATFIDQRVRLNFDYKSDAYDIKFVIQDVRVWGSQSQLIIADGSTTTIHEAWGKIKLNEWLGLKLGRQEINLDDQRIFGSVQWAQQARSHDAAIVQMIKDYTKIHLGLAYNQDGASLAGNYYSVAKSYKSFQYLWLNQSFGDMNASLLFLNLGNQGGSLATNDEKTYFQQTLGGRVTYKKDALSANATIYGQFGDMTDGTTTVKGLLYSIDAGYTLASKHTALVGFEHISGNDQVDPELNKNLAFNPYFGTNHKFNGLMDYFYVGNHIGSVGLNDFNFGYKGKLTDKFNVGFKAHLFSTVGEVIDPTDVTGNTGMKKSLGTEIDFTAGYKLSSEVSFGFGYSQMFATETLVQLRGTGDTGENANWSWLMVTFKPTFFTINKEKE